MSYFRIPLLLILMASIAYAVDTVIPNDKIKFGKAANTAVDKIIEFNQNQANNPRIRWYPTSSKFELYDTAWKDILNESSVDGSSIEWNEAGPHIRVKDNGITNAKLRQSTALSVLGNSSNAIGNVGDIAAGSDGGVLRRAGTAIGFGQVNLGLAAAVTGSLPVSNGGTGAATAQAALNTLAGSTNSGQYLRGNGTNVVMSAIQAADVPTLNQNTTGTAANITATSNSTLTTLSSLTLSGSQVSGNISGSASNVTGVVAVGNGGTGKSTAASAFAALCPPGVIMPFAGNSAPEGFLIADGAEVSRTTYAALFAVIGTTYGAGNGSTTFNLPNTKGVFLRGAGSQTVGSLTYSATLGSKQNDATKPNGLTGSYSGDTADNTINVWNDGQTIMSGRNVVVAYNGAGSGTMGIYNNGYHHHYYSGTVSFTGDSETRPANLAVNYIIKY